VTYACTAATIIDKNNVAEAEITIMGDTEASIDGLAQASEQADNDLAEADDEPTDLSVHVQLVLTPHKKISCQLPVVVTYSPCWPVERNRPRTLSALTEELSIHNIVNLTCQFLFNQIYPDNPWGCSHILLATCPHYEGCISTFKLGIFKVLRTQ
jgi:hypothetical protein